MGKPTGFLEFPREPTPLRDVAERVHDWREVGAPMPADRVQRQGARCMECAVPFCHPACPVHNVIPEFNDLAYRGRWKDAFHVLHTTNNFPEFTGRLCPAPCEAACVLGINQPPVSIKLLEKSIVDRAWAEGWIKPVPPTRHTGKRVAVVGSGPAGLAAAQQLARAGHSVTVFEKSDRPGGLLRYGIPDFKMDKRLIDRRIEQLVAEGVTFECNRRIGGGPLPASGLQQTHDVILFACGAETPRDLAVPGRELRGVHFALDFLVQQNRRDAGLPEATSPILATGKRVVIIGGGDTGADCLGTSLRQGAASVHQLELLPKPPAERSPSTPWPLWPLKLRTESSHEEGGVREWGVMTTRLEGDAQGRVTKLHAVRVEPPPKFEPVQGTELDLPCDLVLLAMGFSGPGRAGPIEELGLRLDPRGNLATEKFATSITGIYAAGDARRGQSLVVWAITEGRQAAEEIDRFLR
ncbi:MAG: glutamate synthase subunit beta [Myxococcales bacterium]